MQGLIPFYGATERELFAIERASMDRAGKVIQFLDEALTHRGLVLDVGAGDGFTAEAQSTASRTVIAMEPASGMIRNERPLPWCRGRAEALPFADGSFDGAYATWAYFFPAYHDISVGLAEIRRVTRARGPVVIVDNAGGDEFTALAGEKIVADSGVWERLGFEVTIIDIAFECESLDDARRLFGSYSGKRGRSVARSHIKFRVACFVGRGAGMKS